MKHQQAGPRRARSVASYLRNTRVMAALAILAFGAAIISDETNGGFWGRHTLLAGLAASVIVVMLTVAVVNEVIERRSRQRWSILAQYVMFELIRNARMSWSGVLEVAINVRGSTGRRLNILWPPAPRTTAALAGPKNVSHPSRDLDELDCLARTPRSARPAVVALTSPERVKGA